MSVPLQEGRKTLLRMLYLILLLIATGLLTLGLVWVIDRFLPQKANSFLIVFFGVLSVFLGYKIYHAIHEPIKFQEVKQIRYSQVIAKLKDIRDAQEAYKVVYGSYARDFTTLIQFIDTGKYTITQQRDSSFMWYDRTYRIEVQKDTVLIDTLGFVAVKDSLFGKSDRYKTLMRVPFAQQGEHFEMQSGVLEKSGYKAPVFEAKVKKEVVLYDQPKDLVTQEKTHQSVEEVNGTEIKVGSLTEVSTNGNWPPIYDRKNN